MKTFNAHHNLQFQWNSPTFVMLVGLPGSGKSTFTKDFIRLIDEDILVASTDDLVEIEAKKLNITYSEMFNQLDHKKLKQQVQANVIQAFSENKSIIYDQTNMSSKTRKSKLSNVPKHYKKICLNFLIDDKILQQRLYDRSKQTGKNISDFIIDSMKSSYQIPSKEEGFDLVIEINNNLNKD